MSESRSVKVSRNINMAYINKVVMLLLTFISRKLFIRYIGIEYLGIDGLYYNILSLLSLADLGFGTAMAYSFYKPLAEGNKKKISALINYYKKIYNYIALAVAILGLSIIPFLKLIVNAKISDFELYLFYILFLSQTVISYLFVYKATLLTADQKNYEVDKVAIIVNITKVVLQIISMVLTRNYVIFLLIMVVSVLVNNIALSIKVDRMFPYIKEKIELKKTEKKAIFVNIKSVFLYKISGTLMNSTDNVLISIIISTKTVGYYSNYYQIFNFIILMIAVIFNSFTPAIGNLVVTENKERRYKVFKIMQLISYYLCDVCSVSFFILIQDFIGFWIGKDLTFSTEVVIAITCNLFFFISMQPMWSYREATGIYRETKYIMLIAAVVNIILSIILGNIIGVTGIIAATVISRIVTYFWYETHLLHKKYFGEKEYRFYIEFIANAILVIICIFIIKNTNVFTGSNIFSWIIKLVYCITVTTVIYVLIHFRDEETKYIKEKMLLIINRR